MTTQVKLNNTSKQYDLLAPLWARARAFAFGSSAVKLGGEKYLPRLSTAQTNKEYASYKDNAFFLPAVAELLTVLTGRIDNPEVNFDVASINFSGLGFQDFYDSMVREHILTRHQGVLVDASEDGEVFIKSFPALDILDWSFNELSLNNELSYVKVREYYDVVDPDTLETKSYTLYRVLTLTDGIYRQRVYTKDSTGTRMLADVMPTVNGAPLGFIPFTFSYGTSPEPKVSLIDAVAGLNESHYRVSAMLASALKGTNTPVLAVVSTEIPESVVLSSSSIFHIEANDNTYENTQIKWAETQGNGISGYFSMLDKIEEQINGFGLSADTTGSSSESAAALRIRTQDSNSITKVVAKELETALQRTLEFYQIFTGSSLPVVVTIPVEMSGEINDI